MKKILHIVESFGGGVFNVIADLAKGTEKDFKIIIAYNERKQTPKDFEKYFSNKVEFIKVKNFTRSINLKKDFKALMKVKKIIKEEKPDIVHLHSSKAGVIGRLAVNGNKVRMLYNPHGFSFLKQDDSKIKRTIYWLIEKVTAMLNRKCTIVGCSKGEYEEARKLNKNSVCINNGIDIEKLKEETKDLNQHQIDYENLKICTVGRIGYQKNPELFNAIAKEMPDLKFTWIGDGELKEQLDSTNITTTGWKTRKEVLKILNEQDIFILTSLWEGLPISLLEAMYMKKICIVSDCIGNRDVIENGKNGFICNNLKSYVKVLKEIAIDKQKNEKFKNKANKDLINKYNNNAMVKAYKKIYSE